MKRRKTHKRKISGVRRSKRSKSHLGGIDITNILAVVGGAVIAGYINKVVPTTVNDKVLAGGKIALGIALPMLSKDGKTKNLLAGAGAGMIAVGSVDLLKSFGVLSGDFDIPTINADVLNGLDLDVVNGDMDELGDDVLGEDELGEDLDEMGEDELGEDED
jgi:hypothetical protein